jgi:hypothetical protein
MQDPEGRGRCLRLKSSLYGLKQAAYEWHSLLISVLIEMGYKAVDESDCFFILHEQDSTSMLVIHVDDVAHGFNDSALSTRLRKRLRDLWGLSGEGELKWFLGMSIKYERGAYAHVSQRAYLETVLKRSGMHDTHPKKTPMSTDTVISKKDRPDVVDEKIRTEFQRIVGSIIFAVVMTRADLANACSQLGRVMSNPTAADVQHAKRVLRYIAGTLDHGIMYTNEAWKPPGAIDSISPITPMGFSDSDWAGNTDDRTSTTGSIVFLAGGPVSWKSKQQRIQALSSAEAEYIAIGETAKDVMYVRNTMIKMGIIIDGPTEIKTDSTAAMGIATRPGLRDTSKHIQLRHHWVRKLINEKQVKLTKVDTKRNAADMLTKALPVDLFERHRDVVVRSKPTDV